MRSHSGRRQTLVFQDSDEIMLENSESPRLDYASCMGHTLACICWTCHILSPLICLLFLFLEWCWTPKKDSLLIEQLPTKANLVTLFYSLGISLMCHHHESPEFNFFNVAHTMFKLPSTSPFFNSTHATFVSAISASF